MTESRDGTRRFHFPQLDIRGQHARLDDTWATCLAAHDYPPVVACLLGELITATALLASTLKFSGTLTMQATGDGPIRTLMAEARDQGDLRAIARLADDFPPTPVDTDAFLPADLLGRGLLTITIRRDRGEPYQGIVKLAGESLASAVEGYFRQSEQIPTRIWLSAAGGRAAGLLVQEMPPELRQLEMKAMDREEHFHRVSLLADTVTPNELRELAPDRLLHRLWNEEVVTVQQSSPVRFHCSCSRERTREALRTVDRRELEKILEEDGHIEMDCQFCHAVYAFDAIDMEVIWRDGPEPDSAPH